MFRNTVASVISRVDLPSVVSEWRSID